MQTGVKNGFTLIEIMICFAVVTTALFGMVSLQSFSLRNVHSAFYRNMAVSQADNLIERLRVVNSADSWNYEWNLAQQQIIHFLPQGRYEYHCDLSNHACTVLVYWADHGQQLIQVSTLV